MTKSDASLDSSETLILPIARSYHNRSWEKAAGQYAASIFDGNDILCYPAGCQIKLPDIEIGAQYLLTTSSHSLPEHDEYARFLETATFGTTEQQLQEFQESSNAVQAGIANWISQQMNTTITPATSHREFWRQGLNARVRTQC